MLRTKIASSSPKLKLPEVELQIYRDSSLHIMFWLLEGSWLTILVSLQDRITAFTASNPNACRNLQTKLQTLPVGSVVVPLDWMDLTLSVVLLSRQGMCTSQTSTSPRCCPRRGGSPPWLAPSLTWVWALGTAVVTKSEAFVFHSCRCHLLRVHSSVGTCSKKWQVPLLTLPGEPLISRVWGELQFSISQTPHLILLRGETDYILKTLFLSYLGQLLPTS